METIAETLEEELKQKANEFIKEMNVIIAPCLVVEIRNIKVEDNFISSIFEFRLEHKFINRDGLIMIN